MRPGSGRTARDPENTAASHIAAQLTVAEVLETYGSEADRILRRYGLYCSGCHHSTTEPIELAARQHGVDVRRVDILLKELNGRSSMQRLLVGITSDRNVLCVDASVSHGTKGYFQRNHPSFRERQPGFGHR